MSKTINYKYAAFSLLIINAVILFVWPIRDDVSNTAVTTEINGKYANLIPLMKDGFEVGVYYNANTYGATGVTCWLVDGISNRKYFRAILRELSTTENIQISEKITIDSKNYYWVWVVHQTESEDINMTKTHQPIMLEDSRLSYGLFESSSDADELKALLLLNGHESTHIHIDRFELDRTTFSMALKFPTNLSEQIERRLHKVSIGDKKARIVTDIVSEDCIV